MSSKKYREPYEWCFVPGCTSSNRSTPNKQFVRVPWKPDLRRKWFEAARRNYDAVSPVSCIYCCVDHFEVETDFSNKVKHDITGCRLRVKEDVVPTIFDCQPDRQRPYSEEERSALALKKRKEIVASILGAAVKDTSEETLITDELILKDEPDTYTDECLEGESILPDAEDGSLDERPWTTPPMVVEPICVWDPGAGSAGPVSPPQPHLLPAPSPSVPATPDAVARELQLLQAARIRTEELNQQLRASLRTLRTKEALLDKELKAIQKQKKSLTAPARVLTPPLPVPALAPLSDITQQPNLAPLPEVASLQNLITSVPALAPLSHQAPGLRPPAQRRCAPRILTRRPYMPDPPPKKPDWPRELVAEWCRLQQARTQAEKVVRNLSAKKAKALEAEKRIEARVEDVRLQRNLVETEISQMEREKAYLNKALGRLTPAFSTRSRTRTPGATTFQRTVGPGAGSSPNSPDDCLGDFQLVFWKKDGIELSCTDLSEPTDPVPALRDLKRPRDHSSSSSDSSVDGARSAQSYLADEKPCKEPKLAEASQDDCDADAPSCSGLCCECGDLLPSGDLLETHLQVMHPEIANRASVPVKEEPTTTGMNSGTAATSADNDTNSRRGASLRPATFCCRHCKGSFATCHERELHQESCTSVAEPMLAQAEPVDPLDGT